MTLSDFEKYVTPVRLAITALTVTAASLLSMWAGMGRAMTILSALVALVLSLFPVTVKKENAAVVIISVPLLSFAVTEAGAGSFSDLTPQCLFLNLAIYAAAFAVLFFATGSLRIGYAIGTCVSFALALINGFVMEFRGDPVGPYDLKLARTALGVASGYDFSKLPENLFASGALFLLILLLLTKTEPVKIEKRRLAGSAISLAVLLLIGSCVQTDFVKAVFGIADEPASQPYMVRHNGFVVNFLFNLKYTHDDPPEGYADFRFPETAPEPASVLESEYPTIIAVMDESFADLHAQMEFESSTDEMPFLHAMRDDPSSAVGTIYVSTVNGGTAETEFEFLTGGSTRFLKPGSTPYAHTITGKTPSLAWLLKSLNYTTKAYHPGHPYAYRRQDVYPLLGFDSQEFEFDFEHNALIRDLVSDAECYAEILRDLKAKPENEKAFYFMVTIQNHGGYTPVDHAGTELEHNDVTLVSPREGRAYAVDNYLTLIRESDRALEHFVNELKEIDEPVLLLFFGDHSTTMFDPDWYDACRGHGTDDSVLTDDEMLGTYSAPFLIWSNYDAPRIAEFDGRIASPSSLSNFLLSAAGMPRSEYLTALERLQRQWPVTTTRFAAGANGIFLFERDNAIPENNPDLAEMACLQYYMLSDKNKDWNKFIIPKESE